MQTPTKNTDDFAGRSPCAAEANGSVLSHTNRHATRRFELERDDRHNPLTWDAPGINARLIELQALSNAAMLTFGEIASRLSTEFAMTISRSACIGRARRLGLPHRFSFMRRRPVKAKAPQPAKVPSPPIAPVEQPGFTPRLLALFELGHNECRFPYGEQVPFLFCGLPTHKDSSWCRHHHKKMYSR